MFPLTDWLVGNDDYETSFSWLRDIDPSAPDAAPVLKLNSAILQQAVADRAARVDMVMGIPALEYATCESQREFERRQREENPTTEEDIARAVARKQFHQDMAEAGITARVLEKAGESIERLTVLYTYNLWPFVAMTIPRNLLSPCIHAYPYSFNYQRSATLTKPENLLYISCDGNAAFASIDHYDRTGPHFLGICLDYEES